MLAGVDKDVRVLEVSVNDSFRVNAVDGFRQLDEDSLHRMNR